MTEAELSAEMMARRWGLKKETLKNWRVAGTGPPWNRRGPKGIPSGTPQIFYPLSGVLAFEAANNITPINP